MNSMPPSAHLTDNQLVLLHYREPLDEAGFDGHLAACPDCLRRFEALSRVLHAVAEDSVPEPAGDFEERLTLKVLSAAQGEERGRLLPFPGLRFPRTTRILSAAAALAASIVLAFSIGRDFGRVEEKTLSAAQTQQRVLLTALGEHLSRSRVTLVEIKNREVSPKDLVALQAAADNLVTASRLFRVAAERAGEGQIAGVMEETERLLMRFAAAPASEAKAELDGLRKRVDDRDLLFRLQVMEGKVETRERNIAPALKNSL